MAAEEQQQQPGGAPGAALALQEQGEELAAQWLDKSVTAAAQLYLEQACWWRGTIREKGNCAAASVCF